MRERAALVLTLLLGWTRTGRTRKGMHVPGDLLFLMLLLPPRSGLWRLPPNVSCLFSDSWKLDCVIGGLRMTHAQLLRRASTTAQIGSGCWMSL